MNGHMGVHSLGLLSSAAPVWAILSTVVGPAELTLVEKQAVLAVTG